MAGSSDFAARGSSGLKFNATVTHFFDRDAVMKAVDKGVRKLMGWFGGYCRKVARNSLKEENGTSRPGQPPFVHTTYKRRRMGRDRKLLAQPQTRLQYKDSILYSLDMNKRETVIGPFLFNGARTSPTVPELLEVGGQVQRNGKILTYRARPHMHPAFEAALRRFQDKLHGFVN